jgi:hypothetical protein
MTEGLCSVHRTVIDLTIQLQRELGTSAAAAAL